MDPDPRPLLPLAQMPARSPPPPSAPRSTINSEKWSVTDLTVQVPASRPPKSYSPQPPRWNTPEFYFYGVMFVLVVPMMWYVPWAYLNDPNSPNYAKFRPRLSESYIPGLLVDDSDAQYRSFRSNLPSLLALVLAYFSLRWAYLRLFPPPTTPARTHLIPFHLLSALLVLLALHGLSTLKILALLALNYTVLRALPPRSPLLPIWTWTFCGAVLFANEIFEGYSFAALHPALAALDAWKGVYPRWHVSFNITMLRIVSYNLDYRWAHFPSSAPPLAEGAQMDDKARVSTAHPVERYTMQNYAAYVLYVPLYIAGPIMTFNDYLHQMSAPPLPDTHPAPVRRYALRFLACLATMEVVLHTLPVVAVKDAHAWEGATPVVLALVGFWNLIVVWLKLLIPWRFFRLFSLLDALSPPENMLRCMANNYSALGFWRSWHRSYNLWIVRYIYIPLGGASRPVLASLVVFTFVALWHDLSFRLLTWGWLVVLFLIPELALRALLPASTYASRPWYRHLAALGGALNVLMMMSANLVGFVLGVDGTVELWGRLVGTWEGAGTLLGSVGCLWIAVQVMFEYREEELRRGIYRRC